MRSRHVLAAGALLAASLLAGLDAPIGAATVGRAPSVALAAVAGLPAVPVGAIPLGTESPGWELSMRVVLEPRDPSALAAFITSASDPSSPRFRRFLPRDAFASHFGPSPSMVRAVRSVLRADGLQVSSVSASHLVLTVRGPAARFVAALHSPIERWRLPDGAVGYRLERAPRLRTSVAHDVAGVVGVSSLVAERSFALRGTGPLALAHLDPHLQPQTCTAAQDAIDQFGGGTFTPTQEGEAYGLANAWDHGDDGTGHTVALLEFAPYAPSDVLAYDKCFQLLSPSATHDPNVHDVIVDGGTSPGSSAASDEPTLDIEELRALSPGARLEVYLGPNNVTGPLDTLQRIATDDTAQAVSISWGICERFSDHAAELPILEQLAAQGETVFAATGDNGSSDCYGQSPPSGAPLVTASVDDPSSQPLVTGVGGLTVDSLSPLTESVWNDCVTFDEPGCLGGAGGGGISALYRRPAWQQAPGAPSGSAPGAHARLVPDLSVMGDPSTGMLAFFQGSYQPFGGTSMGAPLMAALDVVAAQSCGTSTLGFLNPLLYDMGRHGGDFDDVTAGNNAIATSTLVAHQYDAGVGYDMASGLGSPDPTAFLPALCVGDSTAVASPTTPAATSQWTLTFDAGGALYPAGSTVTVDAPANTQLPSSASAWSVADTSGTDAPTAVHLHASETSHVPNIATLTLAQGAVALGAVSVVATGVTNPPIVGMASVTVTDSVDALTRSAVLALEPVGAGAGRGFFPDAGARRPVGSAGALERVFVGDATGLGVAGARLTATASGHGRVRFSSRTTNDLGVGSFVVRDDHAERTTVTVRAGSVVVGRTTVAFTNPWRAHSTRTSPAVATFVGTPSLVETSATREVVLGRTASGGLVVGAGSSASLATGAIPTRLAVASSPTLVRAGPWFYAAYRAPDDHLVVLAQHGGDHLSGWRATDLTAAHRAPRVTGDPRLVVVGRGASARLSIGVVSSAGHLVRVGAPLRHASAFRTIDLTRAAHLPGDAVGDVAEVELGASDEFVVRTTTGTLELVAVEAGRWRAIDVPADAMVPTDGPTAITGNPVAVAEGGLVTIAAVTSGHRLDVLSGTFDVWSGQTIAQGASGASAPAGAAKLPAVTGTPVLAVSGTSTQVFCATTRAALVEFDSFGVADPWSTFDLTRLARAPSGLRGIILLATATPALVGSFSGHLVDVTGGVAR